MWQVGVKDRAKLRGPARRNARPKGEKSETSLHWHAAGLLTKHLAEPAWFTTFPAGGGGEMRGKILKGLGLKSGVPDILIVNPVTIIGHIGLITPDEVRRGIEASAFLVQLLYWIELKKLKSGTLSDVQIDTQACLVQMGCRVANCDNLEDIKAALNEWALPYQAMTPTASGMQSALEKAFANG